MKTRTLALALAASLILLLLCGAAVAIVYASSNTLQNKQPLEQRERGRRRMRRSHAVFCGIARDNAAHLDKTLALIERMGAMFASYKVIVYENDSTDNTLALLQAWQCKLGTQKVKILHEHLEWPPAISDGGFSTRRFEILSYCRNKYVEELRRDEYAAYEHAIVLDMDLWNFDTNGLAHSFGVDDAVTPWSSISANGVFDGRTYYDALAFRSDEFPNTLHSEEQRYRAQRVYNIEDPLVPVKSAFGGLAIYKRACLIACAYTGTDCEHVGMYACQSRLEGCRGHYMNPAMQLFYHL
jgi:hypothetical protein